MKLATIRTGNGTRAVRIDDGACEVREGLHGRADCSIRAKEDTLRGVRAGTIAPTTAFLTGRLRVSDPGLILRFLRALRAR